MSRTLHRLIPSPAMIVALVALVVALGSSGYAQIVPVITGGNIRNNSVTGKDIRNTSLTRKDIRKRSLRGRKFELNSVGGRAIKESRLKTVPSAGSARGLDLLAVVRANGTTPRGRGGLVAGNPPSAVRTSAGNPQRISSEWTTTGNYVVTFDQPVSSCSYLATIGKAPPDTGFPASGQIIVARDDASSGSGYENRVKVRTGNSAGGNEDKPFQLAVIC